jgi:hypothetical protein
VLSEIQSFCGNETEIVLFSDHGMNLERNERVSLKTHLEQRGYAFSRSLQGLVNGTGQRSLATPAFGLCGYAAIYCGAQDARPNVAAALAELEGVDFALYRDSDHSVVLSSAKGAARIEREVRGDEIFFRYLAGEGDPLQLEAVREQLSQHNVLDEQGFASDASWLQLTAAHTYPDVLSNLFTSLHQDRVKHTADVLVSFRDGYYYGWSPFARFVPLEATHGNALRPSSDAFMMSTHRELPEYVRAADARPLLRE